MAFLMSVITALLDLIQVVALSIGLVLAVIPAVGYRDAPFGRILLPLPVVALAFLLTNAVQLLPLSGSISDPVVAGASSIGILAIGWTAFQMTFVLTERSKS